MYELTPMAHVAVGDFLRLHAEIIIRHTLADLR